MQELFEWIFLANTAIFKAKKRSVIKVRDERNEIKFFTCFLLWMDRKGFDLETLCTRNLEVTRAAMYLLVITDIISACLAKVVSVISSIKIILLFFTVLHI